MADPPPPQTYAGNVRNAAYSFNGPAAAPPPRPGYDSCAGFASPKSLCNDGRTMKRRQTTLVAAIRSSLAVMIAAASVCAGCYDGDALVQKAKSAALKTRLAEVDLGKFTTTLPRDEKTNLSTDLDLHIFGTVPRYRLSAVKRQLRVDEYRMRHDTLAAVRKATREELAEPSLAQLRARIEKVVNAILADSPVKEIGFYQLTLRHR
jgi:hypothetical protein